MGYVKTRQTGSHIRLCRTANGEHYLTIPAHDPLKLGTLAAIIADVALHMKISKEETISLIFE